MKYDNIFICPKDKCNNIPEIKYLYQPTNSNILYKCNSNSHGPIEEKIELNSFLKISHLIIKCSICQNLIKDKEFIYSKDKKNFFHNNCLKNYNFSQEDQLTKINYDYLFNNCLVHNKSFIFYCQECKMSLCSQCNMDLHNEKKHTLQQIILLRKDTNKKDMYKNIINKQRKLLNEIKDMNNKLFQSLENDINIKEKILENYEHNIYNVQSIQNFINLEINNNEKYEKILNEFINKKKEYKFKKREEILVNSILSLLYYIMMINNNQKFNENINNILNNKIFNKYEDKNNLNMNKENLNNNINNDNLKEKKNIKIDNINIDNMKEKKILNKDINNEDYESHAQEIKYINQEKSIFNMIVLKSGNIATSSKGIVTIYNSKNLLSNNENDYILQKINISKNKKVSYVYEFPDETLFCSIYSKIFHLKLIENDTNYNFIGIIQLDKFELPSKLISIEDSFLAVLIVSKGTSLLRLFQKSNKFEEKNFNGEESNNQIGSIGSENSDDDNQSAGKLNDYVDYLDKKDIKIDKEFYSFKGNNNINEDKILLCSIYEIKKNNKKINQNEFKYEIISTSNSTFENGKDKLFFYSIKKLNENKLEIKIVKKLEISCSTEPDSICQLNKQNICIGLQKFKEGQSNGIAIIHITKRYIVKIIEDLPISSLSFNLEKKLLYSSMELVDKSNKHHYLIKIFKVAKILGEINLNKYFEFESEHQNIVVSLSEIDINNNKDYKALNNNDNNSIIIATASIDSSLRLNEINII